MNGLHEGDVGDYSLFVLSPCIRHEAHGSNGALNGVEHGQAGEDVHGELLLVWTQGSPGLHIIR